MNRKKSCVLNNDGGGGNNEMEADADSQNGSEIDFDEELFTLYIYTRILDLSILRSFEGYLWKCKKVFDTGQFKNELSGKKVTIKLSTYGGDINVGFAIHDLIVASSLPVTTIAIGNLASAGILPFLAGQHRLMYPNATLLIHKTDQDLENTSRIEKDNAIGQLKILDRMMMKIIEKNSCLNSSLIKKSCSAEKLITAEEALKYGLAHGIIKTANS